jgi:hypothetical protein
MNVILAATYLELTTNDSSGNPLFKDLILNSHIRDIKADGKFLYLNCIDWQSRHYARQIEYSTIETYTYLGVTGALPAFWTLYANLKTQVITQALHP